MGIWLIRIAALAAVIVGSGSELRAASRVALVIGNGDYLRAEALRNPANDASDVAEALKRLGFSVTRVLNANFNDMRQAIRAYNVAVQGADIGLIYYAGHGMELEGENWLIPTDAELKADVDLANEAVGLKTLMQSVSRASGLGLIILDACRDNPFAAKMTRTKLTRSVTRGFARVEPTTNVLVAYAAKDGTTAKDGDRRNSPYTTALLKNLEVPGLEISFVFRNVRDEVLAATHKRQQPFVYGSLSSKAVYLKDGTAQLASTQISRPTPARPAVAAPGPARSADETVWATIAKSSDLQLFESFLSRFPGSAHESAARARVDELQLVKSCDRLVGPEVSRDRSVGESNERTPGPATNACEQGMLRFPDNARFAYQSGWIAENRKDYAGARMRYEKAGAAGSAPALFRIGILYETGADGTPDHAKAHDYYGLAAAAGHQRAMTSLGRLYEAGRGVAQDYGAARRWYEKAASLGDRAAMASMGKLYERGLGVTKDDATARSWFRKAEGVPESEKPAQKKGAKR